MKDILIWDDSLSTGVDEIDLQHKKLILVINDVHAVLDAPEASRAASMSKSLKSLTDYTHYHFSEEEALMRRNAYPQIEAHKTEHAAFVAEVTRQIRGLAQPDPDAVIALYGFLGSWLLTHIAKSDRAWADHLAKRKG